jgi:beta-galactosidase/beta-glucuronidase
MRMHLGWGKFSRTVAIGLAVVVFCAVASAAAEPLPADYGVASRVDLSGLWDFRLDLQGEGEAAHWFADPATSGWLKLAVPGSFNEELARNTGAPMATDAMRFYQGAAWYRTGFASPQDVDGRKMLCYLHLSGTVLRHTVWLNGVKVGGSLTPYLDAAYDITPLLKHDGRNVLVIKVDNSIEKRAIPDFKWHGWWNDGGLIRPVYLELRPAAHSQSYVSTTREAGGWRLAIDTKVHPEAANTRSTISYKLADAKGIVVWRSSPHASRDAEIRAAAVLPGVLPWSPDHPVLYTLTTTTAVAGMKVKDVTTVRIGFREIVVHGTQILLNGAPLTIRGISRHQFLAGSGMSLTTAQDRKDMEEIKSLGANFVRLAHYSQSQDVYDACDELGLLVWTEIPAWQTDAQTLADPAVWSEYAQPQLEQMVMQHRNHPSVVVWSVANEIPTEKPEGAAYVTKAVAYVKMLDQSRLVTFASDRREKDTIFAAVDVIAVNEYFGWYYGTQQDVGPMLDTLHASFPQKPILVSEFGDEGVPGWESSAAKPGGRDYSYAGQAAFLQTHLEQIYAPERRSFMAGGLIWVFNDFPDPNQVGADRPAGAEYINTKGLVTMDRTRKSSFAVVQSFFEDLKTEPAR